MGGWVEGDPAGDRRFLDLPGPFHAERGGTLPGVRVAFETWGTLDGDGGNAVLVEHALTGDSHVVGPPGPGHPTGGWWDGLIGPGRALDTGRFFVVCANVLGGCQGTTGPTSPAPDDGAWGSRFPEVTVGDQVRVEAGWMTRLRTSPMLATWLCSSRASTNFLPASIPPCSSKASTAPPPLGAYFCWAACQRDDGSPG